MPRLAVACIVLLFGSQFAHAQILSYPNPYLDYVYPAGGKQGEKLTVEFGGPGGLDGAKEILIDGPPGITARDVKTINVNTVTATFEIAPDAVPGRRFVRVLGGSNGATNFRYFFVGNLPEVMEKEANETPATAQEVKTPIVVNGRIDKDLDVDCYRFAAKAGEQVVIGILAHGMDSVHRQSFLQGYVDASLELLDDKGKVLATADDTVGLDPVISHKFVTEGVYTVRVQTLSFKGSASSVYRLTIGDVPYPTTLFPSGGRRGHVVPLTTRGFLIPDRKTREIQVFPSGKFPFQFIAAKGTTSGYDLPFLRSDDEEVMGSQTNRSAKDARLLPGRGTVNGIFEQRGEEHWFQVFFKKDESVVFEVTAQRHLRSPIDTVLEVYDEKGKLLAENDDGKLFAHPNQCAGDYSSPDSWLVFKAAAEGMYRIRLRDQNGRFGPSAVYRLSIKDAEPSFVLYQWPDAVPIWGPGTTAAFMVELYHWGLKSDVEFCVDGLPSGWMGSSVKVSASTFGVYLAPLGNRQLLTISAPKDAAIGTAVPFRVFAKVQHEGKTVEREAEYLTLYGNSHNDRMFLKPSPQARAVVANYMDAWPVADLKELTVTHGEPVKIPVRIERKPNGTRANLGIVVNGPTVAASCGMGPPVSVTADQDSLMMPFTVSPELYPGSRGIVFARSWSSDIRGGRPGPCTPLIQLHVLPKKKP